MAFTCELCKKGSFKTQESLQRHVQDSPRHRSDHHCKECDRRFKSLESLQQHIRGAKAHKDAVVVISPVVVEPTTNNTPLDEFFLSFPSFAYGPSLPPAQSYSLL